MILYAILNVAKTLMDQTNGPSSSNFQYLTMAHQMPLGTLKVTKYPVVTNFHPIQRGMETRE